MSYEQTRKHPVMPLERKSGEELLLFARCLGVDTLSAPPRGIPQCRAAKAQLPGYSMARATGM